MPDENMIVPTGHEPATPASAWKPDLVIYHDKCADGIVAAWACWKRWGDQPTYLAANYGYTPPNGIEGRNILIVDFSYAADDLGRMVAAGAKSIVILDHHKTAKAALAPFRFHEPVSGWLRPDHLPDLLRGLGGQQRPPIVAVFDMERSGARMAWDFAHPGATVPRLVELAERYDLWEFTPNTGDPAELLHLDIQAGEMTISRMEELDAELELYDAPIERGAIIDNYRLPLIEEIASRAHLRTVAGIEGVISVECPYSLVSAVGHHLLDKHPTAPFAAMSVTGEKAVTWSLRSHDDRTDVSAVAKSMGGGGHRNAAGFRADHPTPTNPERLVELTRAYFAAKDVLDARVNGHANYGDLGSAASLIDAERELRAALSAAPEQDRHELPADREAMIEAAKFALDTKHGENNKIKAVAVVDALLAMFPAEPAGEEPVASTGWASPALGRAHAEIEKLRNALAQDPESGIDEALRRTLEAIEAADVELGGVAA